MKYNHVTNICTLSYFPFSRRDALLFELQSDIIDRFYCSILPRCAFNCASNYQSNIGKLNLKSLDTAQHVPIPHLLLAAAASKSIIFIQLRYLSKRSSLADMILSRAPLGDCNYNFK